MAGGAGDDLVEPDRKFYRVTVNRETMEVDTRYSGLKFIGGGAYGFVCAAEDSVTGKRVAIKKIKDVFRDLTDAKRILREISLLRHLGGHQNIIWILDIMVSPNRRDFRDLYIVTDLMDTDLSHIISSQQTLSDSHIKYFLYQILRALKYIHSAGVLHRDLKPQNILVNASCELVVCDFGLARATGKKALEHAGKEEVGSDGKGKGKGGVEEDAELTKYVVTRWYRSPELLAQAKVYDAAADMWSVGCILAEILGRRPLLPGRNHLHQLQVIVDLLGTPKAEDLWFVPTHSGVRRMIATMGTRRRVSFKRLFPHANPQAIDLLDRMLQFDPASRITVTQALAHPYLADYHFPDDEPEAPAVVRFDFDHMGKLSRSFLQGRMVEEMVVYKAAREKQVTAKRGLAGVDRGGEEGKEAAAAAAAGGGGGGGGGSGGGGRDERHEAEVRKEAAREGEIAHNARRAMAAMDDSDDEEEEAIADRGGGDAAHRPSSTLPPASTPLPAQDVRDLEARMKALSGSIKVQMEEWTKTTQARLLAQVDEKVTAALTPLTERLHRIERVVDALAAAQEADRRAKKL